LIIKQLDIGKVSFGIKKTPNTTNYPYDIKP